MNKLLFEKDSYRTIFFTKISKQFNISYSDLLTYAKDDVLDLFKGKKVARSIIKNRKKYFVFIGNGKTVARLTENKAKDFFRFFLTQDDVKKSDEVSGTVVFKGKVKAKATVIGYGAHIFNNLKSIFDNMPKGNVLVVDTTSPELLLACKKASAIITNQGGMMSHAAIISREFKIPCIVGTINATQKIKDGDIVQVDAEKGIVKILKK